MATSTVPSDVAFTPSVKAAQEARGSREIYASLERPGHGWETTVTPKLAAFLAERDSFYLATANSAGQPYIQHRGGPKGFLRVLDENTLGFDDYRGNQQYISIGNLAENDQAFIFLMDYEARRRVKIWGRAQVVENDEGRTFLFTISAWDINCPQHIPRKVDAALVKRLESRIAALEGELARLRTDPAAGA